MAITALNVATTPKPENTNREQPKDGDTAQSATLFADLFAGLGIELASTNNALPTEQTKAVLAQINSALPEEKPAAVDDLLSQLSFNSELAGQLAVAKTSKPEAPSLKDDQTNLAQAPASPDLSALAALLPQQPPLVLPVVKAQVELPNETLATSISSNRVGKQAALEIKDFIGPAAGKDSGAATSATLVTTDFSSVSQAISAASQNVSSQNLGVSEPGIENRISAPMQDHATWSKQFGERVILMNSAGQQTAEIHLNPSNLGPMHVTLSFNADQTTSAMFVAHHPETRQAIQDALPQLREMFSSAGISLGQANVSAESQQKNQQNQGQSNGNTPRSSRDTAILPENNDLAIGSRVIPLNRGNGVVDLFA
ncbi:MAG: hypothetical protein RIR18_1663 [Pseudomonadota bacterium]|jgi:flagellar hook-length control protein FliK